MIINCPHCGQRYVSEFSYEGDATIERPNADNQTNQQAWFDYVYARKNEFEKHHELWHHVAGCRQYFVVIRNLRTHEIFSTQTLSQFKSEQQNNIPATPTDEPQS